MKAMPTLSAGLSAAQKVATEDEQYPLIIRELTPKDADVFHYLRVRCIESDPTSFSVLLQEEKSLTPSQLKNLLDRFFRSETSALWGGFCGDYLVGMIGLESMLGPVRRHRGIVTGLCVLPEYRGQQIGQGLIEHVIKQAKLNPRLESLVLEVSEASLAAIRLYQQAGFTENGREPAALAFDDKRLDLIRMNLPMR